MDMKYAKCLKKKVLFSKDRQEAIIYTRNSQKKEL